MSSKVGAGGHDLYGSPASNTVSVSVTKANKANAAVNSSNNNNHNNDNSNPVVPLSTSTLLVLCFLLLATSVGNSVYFKHMTSSMPNYSFFLSQVINIVYVPIFFAFVFYAQAYTTTITPQMTNFDKGKFAVMGLYDGVAGLLMLIGGVYTTGSLQAVLGNVIIPMTMILSVFLARSHYTSMQYMGALIIFIGAAVALVPEWESEQESGSNNENRLIFNFIFVISNIPGALSAVYKEIAFNHVEMDVNYLQAWVAWYQLLFGILLLPFNTLSILGPAALSWSSLIPNLINGSYCLFGFDSITVNCINSDHALSLSLSSVNSTSLLSTTDLPPCDHCSGAYLHVLLYLLFNIANSVLVVLVIKHGSASMMFLVSTLRLPCVQLVFACSLFQVPADPLSAWSIVAASIVVVGLALYRWSEQTVHTSSLPVVHERSPSSLSRGTRRFDYGAVGDHGADHDSTEDGYEGGDDDGELDMNYVYDSDRDEPRGEVLAFGGGASGAGGIDVTAPFGTKVGLAVGLAVGLVIGIVTGVIIAREF